MKLNEVKKLPPFGIYSCSIMRHGSLYGSCLTKKMITTEVDPRYVRTPAQLLKYLKTRTTRLPSERHVQVTDDGMVIKVSYRSRDSSLYWINHTGTLDTGTAVKEYYGLDMNLIADKHYGKKAIIK